MSRIPAVSVIMTVFNSHTYLTQAIDSIRQQTLDDFEFVIVDDGSEDDSAAVLASAKSDPRIRVISQPHRGRVSALNLAWREAQGTYIANLDADDMAEADRLEKQVEFLRLHPGIGLLGTACRVLEEDTWNGVIWRYPNSNIELRNALIRFNPFVHSSAMIPRKVLKEVGGYNTSLNVAVDYELWARIACSYELANLNEVLTVKRRHQRAYFSHRISTWERYKTRIKIRWYIWRKLSRAPTDLRFVFVEPLASGLRQRIRKS